MFFSYHWWIFHCNILLVFRNINPVTFPEFIIFIQVAPVPTRTMKISFFNSEMGITDLVEGKDRRSGLCEKFERIEISFLFRKYYNNLALTIGVYKSRRRFQFPGLWCFYFLCIPDLPSIGKFELGIGDFFWLRLFFYGPNG